jgi:hypothetical protein
MSSMVVSAIGKRLGAQRRAMDVKKRAPNGNIRELDKSYARYSFVSIPFRFTSPKEGVGVHDRE